MHCAGGTAARLTEWAEPDCYRHEVSSSDRPPVVIVGLASVVGLQTARIFAADGIRVIGLAGDRAHFAARTNACHEVIQADVHRESVVAVLERLGPTLGGRAVLVPATDQAVLHISAHRERLEPYFHVPMAEHPVVHALLDKGGFAQLTSRLGMRTPETRLVTDRASALVAASTLSFPLVVKPTVKSREWRRFTGSKVLLVHTPDELQCVVHEALPTVPALVVQEFVQGGDEQLLTCNAYFDRNHEALATFVSRKKRQWPPHLGIASYAEPCVDTEVRDRAVELFSQAGFRGLAYVEFKRDPVSGSLSVIEANVGRPTGRSAMAEACGVSLMKAMYADAVGLPLPPASSRVQGAAGPGWIDVRRDAMAAWHYWRQGELTVAQWVDDVRGAGDHAVLSSTDPVPFGLELVQSARKLFVRMLRRVVARTWVQADK